MRLTGVTAIALMLAANPARADTADLFLPAPAVTSAGIFDQSGRLVRTLWSGRSLPAGPVAVQWDGRDDDGVLAPEADTHEARILSHNIRYEWEGVIGNTSSALPGAQIHRAYGPVNDMAFDARGNAFYVVGYNEAGNALHRFDARNPQQRSSLGRADIRRIFRYAATDGELAYFANIGLAAERGSPFRGTDTFVVAFDVRDGREHTFSSGRRRSGDFNWESAADHEQQQVEANGVFPNAPSGLAVQRRGALLMVAHRGLNLVRFFDKKDGRALGAVAVEGPGEIDVAPDDSFWVICRVEGRKTVAHFRQHGGTWAIDRQIDTRDIDPVAIGVSPVDGSLAVADARTEQVRGYDEKGRSIWILGRAGGYGSGGTDVAVDRFGFAAGPAYLAYQADGSLWIGDPANERNVHFSRDRRYLDQIQYLSHSYVATVDMNRPQRVFRGYLEFAVDYARPLRDSWKLVRNWSVGLDSRYGSHFAGLRQVVTLANGRTYATVFRRDNGGDELVELAPEGVRPLGIRLRIDEQIRPDGSLRSHLIRFGTLQVYERRLERFGPNASLVWSEPALKARVSGLGERDPHYHDVPLVHGVNNPVYPETGSGLLISFNPGKSPGFHLGAMRPGDDRWIWRASPSGAWQVDERRRIVTRDGTFETGRGVHYPGSVALAAGSNIIYGYHGEAWNDGQANQWMHFHESGLFLGQFGESPYPNEDYAVAKPGAAGNAFCPSLVIVDGELFVWHNDEGVHGGVHRWRVANLGSVRVQSAVIHSN